MLHNYLFVVFLSHPQFHNFHNIRIENDECAEFVKGENLTLPCSLCIIIERSVLYKDEHRTHISYFRSFNLYYYLYFPQKTSLKFVFNQYKIE